MALGKQAKLLSRAQIDGALGYIAQTRYQLRNRVTFLLSVKAGLRAKVIASVTWDMLVTAEGAIGRALHLRDAASKGRSGRIIPLNEELRDSVVELWNELRPVTLREPAIPSLLGGSWSGGV
jgi:integrase